MYVREISVGVSFARRSHHLRRRWTTFWYAIWGIRPHGGSSQPKSGGTLIDIVLVLVKNDAVQSQEIHCKRTVWQQSKLVLRAHRTVLILPVILVRCVITANNFEGQLAPFWRVFYDVLAI